MDLNNIPNIIVPEREMRGVSFAQFYADGSPFFRYGRYPTRRLTEVALSEEFDCLVLEEIIEDEGIRMVTGGVDALLVGGGQMNYVNGKITLYGQSRDYPGKTLIPDKYHAMLLPYCVGQETSFLIEPPHDGKSREQLIMEAIEFLRIKLDRGPGNAR